LNFDPSLLSDAVRTNQAELAALRRELHRHPELAWQERKTQARVISFLREAGLAPSRLCDTGVVAVIEGQSPGPALMLRADLDALPIEEKTGLGFASQESGRMHACGHDAHVAMLLMAGRLLAERPPARGSVKLVFQPAEEVGEGARAMIEHDLLVDPPVERALSMHVWSGVPVGQVQAVPGPAFASVDTFELIVRGKGTHAARPEQGLDPVPIAAQIISAAQSLVARRLAPDTRAVFSVSSIQCGQAFNVIPEEVCLRGTIRTFDRAVRDQIVSEFTRLAENMASGFGATAEYKAFEQLPPLLNDPAVTERSLRVFANRFGDQAVGVAEALMVGEDFGLFLQQVPGAMLLLGCGDSDQAADFPHHHPRFTVDEGALPIGVQLWLDLVADFLGDG
jgi:amidohydrolase